MKITNGWISNSSSSSFLVLATPEELEQWKNNPDIKREDKDFYKIEDEGLRKSLISRMEEDYVKGKEDKDLYLTKFVFDSDLYKIGTDYMEGQMNGEPRDEEDYVEIKDSNDYDSSYWIHKDDMKNSLNTLVYNGVVNREELKNLLNQYKDKFFKVQIFAKK